MSNKEPSILVYDIETTLLKSWHFGLGKQVLRHNSLDRCYKMYGMICLSYMYDTDKKPTTIGWGEDGEGSEVIIEQFDKVIKEAKDKQILIVGKNNKRFDDKHINTHQWLTGGEPMPQWATYTEDLESQLRKQFYFPSFSLDAISELRGYGGKEKMDFSDWVDNADYKLLQIAVNKFGEHVAANVCELYQGRTYREIMDAGREAYAKMKQYNAKDVSDTMALVLDVLPYCKFKSTIMPRYKGELRCLQQNCGSTNLARNGTRILNGVRYQQFLCKDTGHYAGRARILDDGTFGKMMK